MNTSCTVGEPVHRRLRPPSRRGPVPTVGRPARRRVGRTSAATPTPAEPAWPSFTGTATYVGTSDGVDVWIDASLGNGVLQDAHYLLSAAADVVAENNAIFAITGGPVSVIIFALDGETNGTGGADHLGCTFTNGNVIEVCASFGNSVRDVALFEAELSECAMDGSLCGLSNGEALSRWCAALVGSNSLSDFATAPLWSKDHTPDWVNQTDQTDQDDDSIGCGMAFISWLISLGQEFPTIAQTMVNLGDGGTLAQLYADLTGDPSDNAWTGFMAAVNALPGGVTTDDPFNGYQAALASVQAAA
jgi:hypothetical protein